MPLSSWLRPERWRFTLAYLRGLTPWDTGIVPPEIVAVVEGAEALPPGRALDLGCGTGTNSLYLARHGWQVVGVDFAAPAIAKARARLREAGSLAGSVAFYQGDVTALERLPAGGPYSLLIDLGCVHGVPAERRPAYAAGVAERAASGALFLLYAFSPGQMGSRPVGMGPDEVRRLFGDAFTIERSKQGTDRRDRPSTWYWLRRK
jgi:SAM-dependent methyltransferase